MDSFEFNKIAGALLATCLALLALNITSEAIFAHHRMDKAGYEIAVQPEAHGAGAEVKAAAEEPFGKLLAGASVDKGKSAVKVCASCHTFEKGGANGTGPNLYGILERGRASAQGFAYSDALKAKGGAWTADDLNKFLASPKDFAPGTKMGFQGLSKGAQRADVIAYLNSLANSPKPLAAQ
jgi:cytochrome c